MDRSSLVDGENSGRYNLKDKIIINKGTNYSQTEETEYVHLSDITNPNMISVDQEPEWRLGSNIVELRTWQIYRICHELAVEIKIS